jgi:hypothetical protein
MVDTQDMYVLGLVVVVVAEEVELALVAEVGTGNELLVDRDHPGKKAVVVVSAVVEVVAADAAVEAAVLADLAMHRDQMDQDG